MLRERLNEGAMITIQCTSPLAAPKSYWCIVSTLEAAGYQVRPYHAPVPTFGEWGFILASTGPIPGTLTLSDQLTGASRYLNDEVLNGMFVLPPDLSYGTGEWPHGVEKGSPLLFILMLHEVIPGDPAP